MGGLEELFFEGEHGTLTIDFFVPGGGRAKSVCRLRVYLGESRCSRSFSGPVRGLEGNVRVLSSRERLDR